MEEMEKELKEIIEKQLPKHLSDTLQGRLNKLSDIENEVDELEVKIREMSKENNHLSKVIVDLENKLQCTEHQLTSYTEREAKLLQRENDVRFVELERDQAKERLGDLKEMTRVVFRNNVVRKQIFISEDEDRRQSGNYDANGNPITAKYTSKNISEETKEMDDDCRNLT